VDRSAGLGAAKQPLIPAQSAAECVVPAWESAHDSLVNVMACLTGNGACPSGEARDMTLVDVSDADFKKARAVLVNEVLPDWAERAGGDWGARWNESVGSVVGVSIGG